MWPGANVVYFGLLIGALITAATASLLALLLFALRFSTRIVLITALGYGLCTIAWTYARMLWGLPVSTAAAR